MPHTAGPVAVLGPAAITVPVLVACLLLACGRCIPRGVGAAAALLTTVALAAAGGVLLAATRAATGVTWLGGWIPTPGTAPVGIPLVIDPATGVLVALVGLLGAAALLFGWRYVDDALDRDGARFPALVLLFLAGMTGFVVSGDLFDMLVFFELMGAVGYALAADKIEEARSVQGGLSFGVVNSLGAYVALCGIGLIYARTGRLGLAPIGDALGGAPADAGVAVGFVLVLTGWLVKAAAVPFHFWLADAHAVAPTPVCALFSGVMAPLGVYGVARVGAVAVPVVDVRAALTVLGVLTAVVAAVMCVLQRHLKRLLAYSTIAHVGLFLVGTAAGPAGAASWVTGVAGHAGVKGALFLLVGVLLARFGSVDEIALHGAVRGGPARDRVAGVLLLLGGLALAGLPPFGPGLGEAALEEAVPAAVALAAALVPVLTGAAVLRVGLRVVLGAGPAPADRAEDERTSGEGEERETPGRLDRVPMTMLAAATLLLAGAVVVGTVGAVRGVLGDAGARLGEGPGYRAAVAAAATGRTVPAAGGEPVAWHLAGVLSGAATTAVALGVALAVVHLAPRHRAAWPAATRALRRGVVGLERLHSGHLGDYVAWMLLGVAALGAGVVLPHLG